MAMTITPGKDFAINQHSQAQIRTGQENSAARAKDNNSSSLPVPPSSRGATDSVELSTAAENLASAGSQLADFDQAQETMAKLKNAIYSQAGIALQTQGNISPETAFALLSD